MVSSRSRRSPAGRPSSVSSERSSPATVRVSRQLPSVLTIEISERHAAAVVNLGGLYLADVRGRPFKRATMDEAAGLPVITGVARGQYAARRDAVEAATIEVPEALMELAPVLRAAGLLP